MSNDIAPNRILLQTYKALNEGVRFIAHQGGTYSGKTVGILIATALHLNELNERKTILVVGQAGPEMDSGVYKDWLDVMEMLPIGKEINKTKRVWQVGKCNITFKTVDKIGKAKSGKRYMVFINECNHHNWEIVEQLIVKSTITILDWNPSSKFWFHKKIKPNIENYKPYLLTKTTYKDNKAITQEDIHRIETMWSKDPQKYACYVLGELGVKEGQILTYNTFHEWPENARKRGYFLDFGYTNDVTSLGEARMLGDAIYSKQHIYKTGLLTKELNDLMNKIGINKKIPIYCDNIPKEVAELAVYGWILIKAKKGPGSVKVGLDRLKQYDHFVHISSTDAHEEFENYEWLKVDGEYTNEPIDKYNHFIDGLRYYGEYNCRKASTGMGQHAVDNLV